MTTCTVYFRNADGVPQGGHVTAGNTLFEVCQRAVAWFWDDHWKGFKPDVNTVLEVATIGRPEKKYFVRVGALPIYPEGRRKVRYRYE